MQRMSVLAPLTTVMILLGSATSYAQLVTPPPPDLLTSPTLVNGVLTMGNTVLQTDDAATQEELPGLGHKFELFGSMIKDTDPENSAGLPGNAGGGAGGNEVISTDTSLGMAFAYRKLNPGIKIRALTNQINLKYYFVAPRSCAAGSPRVVLLIDTDNDGQTDFAANGHVFPPTHAGCVSNRWAIEDLTDEGGRWELTAGGVLPLPAFPYAQWDVFVAAVNTTFPNHKILAGFLLDGESCTFGAAGGCGKAYYDLLTIENRTLEIWQDAVKQ